MSIYDFSVATIDGQAIKLDAYKNKVLLIVNTASKCGFTPQYAGLQKLYSNLHIQGVEVLGFPCNQFGAQEPGSEEEIRNFCSLKYDVSFPMFAKIDVNGEHADPLFKFLKKEAPGLFGTEAIKWNFTKFLVNREGNVIKRFAPTDTPEKIAEELQKLL